MSQQNSTLSWCCDICGKNLKGFLPVWTLRWCSASLCASKKPLPHHSHACGRSFECLKQNICKFSKWDKYKRIYFAHWQNWPNLLSFHISYIPRCGRGLKRSMKNVNLYYQCSDKQPDLIKDEKKKTGSIFDIFF